MVSRSIAWRDGRSAESKSFCRFVGGGDIAFPQLTASFGAMFHAWCESDAISGSWRVSELRCNRRLRHVSANHSPENQAVCGCHLCKIGKAAKLNHSACRAHPLGSSKGLLKAPPRFRLPEAPNDGCCREVSGTRCNRRQVCRGAHLHNSRLDCSSGALAPSTLTAFSLCRLTPVRSSAVQGAFRIGEDSWPVPSEHAVVAPRDSQHNPDSLMQLVAIGSNHFY